MDIFKFHKWFDRLDEPYRFLIFVGIMVPLWVPCIVGQEYRYMIHIRLGYSLVLIVWRYIYLLREKR